MEIVVLGLVIVLTGATWLFLELVEALGRKQ
jgi:hypothetical protein